MTADNQKLFQLLFFIVSSTVIVTVLFLMLNSNDFVSYVEAKQVVSGSSELDVDIELAGDSADYSSDSAHSENDLVGTSPLLEALMGGGGAPLEDSYSIPREENTGIE